QHYRYQQKVDYCTDKCAPIDENGLCHVQRCSSVAVCVQFPHFDKWCVHFAESVCISATNVKNYGVYDWFENAVGQRRYYCSECRPDNGTDCHVHNVATGNKFFEFSEKVFHIYVLCVFADCTTKKRLWQDFV